MSIKTNLHGRLRNTPLPASHGLMPLFEAVVNSIHSIEEADNITSGRISVDILRHNQSSLAFDGGAKTSEPHAEIVGFIVCDNGIGFNDVNMKSFETLDSEHKADKGCRGVGRLLWLKAFNKIKVSSVFKDNTSFIRREFVFDSIHGVSEEKSEDTEDSQKTCVHLDGFEKRYRDATSKTIGAIANAMLEHCLWYFIRTGGSPSVVIRDGDDYLDLEKLLDAHMHSKAITENIEYKGQKFHLTHIKFHGSSKNHSIAYCASSRLVKEESISGKLPGLHGKISDNKGDFVYSCYVSGEFLNEHVRSERTGFDLAEMPVNGLFSDNEITLQELKDEVLKKVKEHLEPYLHENILLGKNRVQEFVAKKAPRYRPILTRIPEERLAVDPDISDKDLDIMLHKHLSEVERQLLESGHSIMKPSSGEGEEEYQERLHEYLKTAEDIKKSDLANYVSHRRVILDLLEMAIQRNSDGKYAREDLIHELIMPMRKESNEVFLDGCNLWLLDERLAFHDYLASDKTISSMPITGSSDTKEPDLCSLNVCDNPILVSDGKRLPLASIVIVEIKRPMRNDARAGEDKDLIEQALGYLNRIRKGGVTTANGRLIPNSEDIPGYCYVICDLTESVENRCRMLDLTVTSDHMGYFGFHKQFKSYIEVISFDRLVNSAKERNRAFFDKLGLPTV